MIVDNVVVHVKAGNGGNGSMSFRRELYVANGGPDGGDGGHGASIYLQVNSNLNTLSDFRYNKNLNGDNGEHGSKRNKTGKSAEDIYIPVPLGTIVKNVDSNRVIKDMSKEDDVFLLAKGGRGGRGNQHFVTSTRQIPKFAEMGEKGEEKNIELELKMIADVGLLGFPNVGKSTLISTISNAKPKIANYHFTTLEPTLGVVKPKYSNSFIMADIPGIIEGASDGIGLGIKFLKHIERCKILIHVLDVSEIEGRDFIEDYYLTENELKKYSEKLYNKKRIVALNKIDSINDLEKVSKFEKICKNENIDLFKISSITKDGLDEFIEHIGKVVEKIPKETIVIVEEDIVEDRDEYTVNKTNEGYYIYGPIIERIMSKVNVLDLESRQYMNRVLVKEGIIKKLKSYGMQSGDTIDVNGFKFEYEE